MTRIVALSGSLRKRSFNTALVNAAAGLFPEEILVASISGIPLYNEDIENSEGIPTAVSDLKDLIAEADGLLLATPEYNNTIPGVFKNAIDWLSRPTSDIPRVFHNKPVAVTGASPGGFGTTLSQTAWLPVLRTLRTRPWFEGRLMVSRAHGLVDENGVLTDEETLKKLRAFVGGFIEFCRG
jgi:chromate reductase